MPLDRTYSSTLVVVYASLNCVATGHGISPRSSTPYTTTNSTRLLCATGSAPISIRATFSACGREEFHGGTLAPTAAAIGESMGEGHPGPVQTTGALSPIAWICWNRTRRSEER